MRWHWHAQAAGFHCAEARAVAVAVAQGREEGVGAGGEEGSNLRSKRGSKSKLKVLVYLRGNRVHCNTPSAAGRWPPLSDVKRLKVWTPVSSHATLRVMHEGSVDDELLAVTHLDSGAVLRGEHFLHNPLRQTIRSLRGDGVAEDATLTLTAWLQPVCTPQPPRRLRPTLGCPPACPPASPFCRRTGPCSRS